jgi:hypothetical protein
MFIRAAVFVQGTFDKLKYLIIASALYKEVQVPREDRISGEASEAIS